MQSKEKQAFTLAELVVVLVIVALLAAIILPAFERAKGNPKSLSCLSGIHQVGRAVGMYRADYDNVFPPGNYGLKSRQNNDDTFWCDLIWPYIRAKGNQCPEAASVPTGNIRNGRPALLTGYAYNIRLTGTIPELAEKGKKGSGTTGIIESKITYPALTVLLNESRVGILTSYGPDIPDAVVHLRFNEWPADLTRQKYGGLRHRQAGNYAYVDGHASRQKPDVFVNPPDGVHPSFVLPKD